MRNPRALVASRSRLLAGLVLAAAVTLTAGCGPEGFALDSPANASNGRRGNADDGADSLQSREQVLKQYRKFWRVTSHLTDVPSHERPALIKEVATNPILPVIMTNLARMDTAGEVLYGQPRARSPKVEFDGRTAIVRDCQDTSNSGRKKESTGQILSKGVSRAAVTVTLKRGDDGLWRASKVDYPGGKRC